MTRASESRSFQAVQKRFHCNPGESLRDPDSCTIPNLFRCSLCWKLTEQSPGLLKPYAQQLIERVLPPTLTTLNQEDYQKVEYDKRQKKR